MVKPSLAARQQLQDEEDPTVPAAGTVMLDNDRPLSMLPYLAELLDDAKIRVLVYNADLDMSVCAQGSENALDAMKWSGAEQWATADRALWTTKHQVDKVAGYVREVQGSGGNCWRYSRLWLSQRCLDWL